VDAIDARPVAALPAGRERELTRVGRPRDLVAEGRDVPLPARGDVDDPDAGARRVGDLVTARRPRGVLGCDAERSEVRAVVAEDLERRAVLAGIDAHDREPRAVRRPARPAVAA